MEKTLLIKGMSCSHCAMRVEKALNKMDGVENAKVDLGKHIAKVTLSKPIEKDEFLQVLDDAGYQLSDVE